jgi:hypothetical protein
MTPIFSHTSLDENGDYIILIYFKDEPKPLQFSTPNRDAAVDILTAFPVYEANLPTM